MAAQGSISPDSQPSGTTAQNEQSSAARNIQVPVQGQPAKISTPKPRKPRSTKRSGTPRTKIQLIIEGVSLFVHGIHGVLAHLMLLIPGHVVKGILFVAILVVVVYEQAIKHPESHELCFGAYCTLALIALGLIAVLLRNPGTDDRLRDMQDERIKAIKVKPLY